MACEPRQKTDTRIYLVRYSAICRGLFGAKIRGPKMSNKQINCGCCDTGTDADFDTYAVQVQNGDGYYDEAGRYHSYHIYDD